MSKALALEHEEAMNTEKTVFGFWVYLMTDCVLFATLFATYVVLQNATFGGPSGQDLFSLPFVFIETMLLLTSSFVCGLAILAARRGKLRQVQGLFGLTFLLGAAFVGMELYEFGELIAEGHSWQASAFLSAFFTLVATHGLHVTIGLLWLLVLLVQSTKKGLSGSTIKRMTLFSIFWHFLDIIWILLFTIVYLLGVI